MTLRERLWQWSTAPCWRLSKWPMHFDHLIALKLWWQRLPKLMQLWDRKMKLKVMRKLKEKTMKKSFNMMRRILDQRVMAMVVWPTWCSTPTRSSPKRKQPTSMPTTRHTKMWDVNFKPERKDDSSSSLVVESSRRARTKVTKDSQTEREVQTLSKVAKDVEKDHEELLRSPWRKQDVFLASSLATCLVSAPTGVKSLQATSLSAKVVQVSSKTEPMSPFWTLSTSPRLRSRKFAVYAGVQTCGHEAVVDTAAEEAVIGSTAMMQLIARFGLQPAQAPGSTGTCAGIGGSAKIVGVIRHSCWCCQNQWIAEGDWDFWRGCVQDTFPAAHLIHWIGGSGHWHQHWAVHFAKWPKHSSETSFIWTPPEQLREELNLKDGNPFALPKKHMRKNVSLRQQPGVAAWLKTDDQLQYMGTLKGRRTTLVDPKRNFQCFGDFHIETFKGDSGFIFRYAFSISYVHTWFMATCPTAPTSFLVGWCVFWATAVFKHFVWQFLQFWHCCEPWKTLYSLCWRRTWCNMYDFLQGRHHCCSGANAQCRVGKQFENDTKNVAVQRDVKHVHFADVPADVKVFSRDVNVDAKDQAVLSCNSASSESSSTQGPITPNKTKLTADQLLEQQLLKAAREKESRKKMSSGVILA